MSAPANKDRLLISNLAAFGIDESNQHVIFPSPPMTLSPNPSLASVSMTSDDGLRLAYWHKPEAYEDNIGKYYIDTMWKRHLDSHGYTRSFQPLQGTERERYRYIIDGAHRKEVDRIKNEELLYYRLCLASKAIENQPKEQLSSAQFPTQPQPQYKESAELVKAGMRELKEFKAFRQPLRHERQHPAFKPFAIRTSFGDIEGKNELHQEHWFMGHRPGDPIMRIVDAPRPHPIFGLDDLHHHPVLGHEDFDIAQLYFRFRHEGIVPFNYSESQQRIEDHVFPAFLTIIIAALGFNPNEPEADVPPQLGRIWTILMQDMADIDMETKDELVRWMSVLQRIWKIKYGTASSKLPRFLQAQFRKSRSRLGEMAWLVCKVVSMLPGYHILRCFVDWFLQAMVGANLQSMANWYFTHQLGREAKEQMQEGDIKDTFFYRSDRPLEEVCEGYSFFFFFSFPPSLPTFLIHLLAGWFSGAAFF
ncbi:hypothetical protein F4775DRAFT_558645 [Biscogniauxia sp. FL1348]|nr:hypothetical protein F4775DRAFT_558645 [Biscogniauxia sp. FL1348]